MLTTHNVRLGFATNSSSTHSIILLKHGKKLVDRDVATRQFGCEHFTCASLEAKLGYFALQVYYHLVRDFGDDAADILARVFTGGMIQRDTEGLAGYINHDSCWAGLPRAWDDRGLDREFLADLKAWLERSDVAILGGNDNDGLVHQALKFGQRACIPLRDGPVAPDWFRWSGTDKAYAIRARKDKQTGIWTLFNTVTGAKIQFSFTDATKALAPTKLEVPELVDLKITDFCDRGCAFCYQDSKPDGKHAGMDKIQWIIDALAEMRMFECALGGGEPTKHPEFASILARMREHKIVPSFTTRDLHWMADPKISAAVAQHAGAFAVSVRDDHDVNNAAYAVRKARIPPEKMAVQYVMGTGQGAFYLERILRAAAAHNCAVTLLGFKRVGRGRDLKPHDYHGWLDTVLKLQRQDVYVDVGIDTALACQSKRVLAAAKIPSQLYYVNEGKFSMYVDAVRGLVGPSSYEPDRLERFTFRPWLAEANAKRLAKRFARW